jgi:type II secretory pathway predicted ATPase ExeA
MYQSHWGLDETPFRNGLDSRWFYQSPVHEEALARLHFLVEQRRRLGLLLGDHGSGKSLLMNVFAGELKCQGHQASRLSLLGLEPHELLWHAATGLGMNPNRSLATVAVWQLLADRVAANRYQDISTVMLFDDADQAGETALAAVARLVQMESAADARLTIVLAARPEGVRRLGQSLLERAELRIDLEPWEPADTEAFLKTSLAQAGCAQPVFDDPAIDRLHQLGQGIPRRISQLADLALLAGAGRGLGHIDAQTIDSVYRELGVIEV